MAAMAHGPTIDVVSRTRVPRRPHQERHAIGRIGWLRAAVLGANDGLLSTASLLVGVAAADVSRSLLLTTGIAAVVAGAASMAVGEYSSVSSQRDAELADLSMEQEELLTSPRTELAELQGIYMRRGLDPALAHAVAVQLTAHDALASHARDELGLDPTALARPVQAAVTSAVSFSIGAMVPLLCVVAAGRSARVPVCIAVTLGALGVLGAVGAGLGNASWARGAWRVLIGGAVAMAVTFVLGDLVGAAI
jgi:VIT1/CCC1 family predicted Fe2+/Mn2+ transporter